ncbi:MAG: hypothetical protein V4577_24095 [Bacteroidota bacterium]
MRKGRIKILLFAIFHLTLMASVFGQSENDEFNAIQKGNSGWLSFEKAEYDNCITLSKNALKIDSSLSYIRFNIALCYLMKGQNEYSISEYENAINAAKRFGIPQEDFQGTIDDLLKYAGSPSLQSIVTRIINEIKIAAKEYSVSNNVFLHVPIVVDSVNVKEYSLLKLKREINSIKISITNSAGGVIWTSDRISSIEPDSLAYFFRMSVPEIIMKKKANIKCHYFYNSLEKGPGSAAAMENHYWDEKKDANYSSIKLNLISSPKGASVFLIPNRIWQKQYENKDWQTQIKSMDRFRVDGSTTNTIANIDETVYVIIFQLNTTNKKRTYFTKAALVQPEQTVTMNFNE